jgi:hypothetical protein
MYDGKIALLNAKISDKTIALSVDQLLNFVRTDIFDYVYTAQGAINTDTNY